MNSVTIGLAFLVILLQYWRRRIIQEVLAIPTHHCRLLPPGGDLITAIAVASIIKTISSLIPHPPSPSPSTPSSS